MINDCASSVTTADRYGIQFIEKMLHQSVNQETIACTQWREYENDLSEKYQITKI